MITIVGLGNPSEEYENTRHNAGRMAVIAIHDKYKFKDFKVDKASHSLISKGTIEGTPVLLILPETYMNKSGVTVLKFIKSKKSAENMIVIHDELDLPLGSLRLSFNRSAGGHRGVMSIISVLKSEAFLRMRLGISLATPKGILKKPIGDKAVESWILGKFKNQELANLKKAIERAVLGVGLFITEGREKAMSIVNGGLSID